MSKLLEISHPLPTTIGVREFTRDFPKVTARLKRSKMPLFVMSHNKPAMMVLDVKTYQEFTQWLEDRHDAALLKKVMRERSSSKSIPWQEAKKMIEDAV